VLERERGATKGWAFFVVLIAIAVVAVGPIWLWARHIEKRVGSSPDRPGHEADRFHFKYGGEPPGAD
jgi:hypothetical protein